MSKKKNASSLISELKGKTRRNYSSEAKIRIIIEGMHGEMTPRSGSTIHFSLEDGKVVKANWDGLTYTKTTD